MSGAEELSAEDLTALADLIVLVVLALADRLVADPDHEDRIVAAARRRLWMLLLGARNWHSDG